MRKDKSPRKKAEWLNVNSERLQGKGHVSVASFSRSFLRSDRQEYSPSCHRLGTPKIPALLCQILVMLVCRSQQKALLALPLLTWAGLARYWSMDHARYRACHRQWRTTTWLILCRPQSGVGPAAGGAS